MGHELGFQPDELVFHERVAREPRLTGGAGAVGIEGFFRLLDADASGKSDQIVRDQQRPPVLFASQPRLPLLDTEQESHRRPSRFAPQARTHDLPRQRLDRALGSGGAVLAHARGFWPNRETPSSASLNG